jgi:tetratricopeptide (TPR) repeat protein
MEAESFLANALAIAKPLADEFPGRPENRQELARSQHRLGNVYREGRRLKEAESAFSDALVHWNRLAASVPSRTEFCEGLARCHNDLGVLLFSMDRLREAETAYAEALALRRQLAAAGPKQPDLRNDLAGTCVNLALVCLRKRDFRGAKAYLAEAAPHHEAALKTNPRNPDYRQFYRNNLRVLIRADAGLGDPAGALQAGRTLRDLSWDPPAHAYDAARMLALCIPIVRSDDQTLEDERDQQAAFYGDEAVKMLRDAVAKGWKNAAHVQKDAALAPLRERDDFKTLLAELQAKQK